MGGPYLDGDVAQLRHGFLGRAAMLDELDRLLVDDPVDRWVVVTGGPGTGKTALLAAWLARRTAARDFVVHHFVRRQQADRIESSSVARSLAAQIEDRYPALRDRYARPEARLSELLARVSACELGPHGIRMALVIDGLDERHPTSDLREVLALLPRSLPPGVRVLCAGRHRDPEREAFEGRCGRLARLDLDDPSLADDRDATVRAVWQREAPALALDEWIVEHAVRCADGNVLHACALSRHLASLQPSQRSPGAVPHGLVALFDAMWQRAAGDPAAVRALGILCAARAPLSPAQLDQVAGWTDPGDHRAAIRAARALIVEPPAGERGGTYRLFHDAMRSHLVERLGPAAIRGWHRELAARLATWPAPGDPASRRYALHHAIGHRIAAGDCRAAHALANNVELLEAKWRELGVDELERDVRRAAEACLAAGELSLAHDLDAMVRAIARESIPLRDDAGPHHAAVWHRLRPTRLRVDLNERRPPSSIGGGAMIRAAAAPVARPALLRDLVGGGGAVTACATTRDGRRAISASADHSLKLWDLHTGRVLRHLTGHTDAVASCAVAPDGRRLVSASADTTLRVWDLDTGHVLATLEGHADTVESCAIAPDGRRVISASSDTTLRVWDLDTGAPVSTLEGHTDAVTHCAVTPDGRRIISASADTTLKVWDLDTGHVLATLAGHARAIASCCVSPDGRRVVSGSTDHTLRVWNADTGGMISTLAGHDDTVTCCVISPSGRLLCSSSLDSTLRIWDLDTGRALTTLDGHDGPVTCCAITPDGSRLVSGSFDQALKVWALDGSCAATAIHRLRSGEPAAPERASRTLAKRARRSRESKHIILFLAANPKSTTRLALEEECAAIESELQMARHGNDFEFRSKWVVTVDEMARHLIDLEPAIIHFSGHGRGRTASCQSTTARDVVAAGASGIYLHDDQQGAQLVGGRALALMVKSSAPSARIVVLNACYSDGHAEALCQVVDCVVGMTRAIRDSAARSFAVAFYRALGNRRSVGNAVEHAVATLTAKYLADETIPRCRTRDQVDSQQIVL